MLALLLRGAAALHPSMPLLTEPAPRATRTLSRPRLALLAGVATIAPAVDVIQDLRRAPRPTMVIAGATVVLFVLALARLRGLAIEVGAQAERQRLLSRILRATEEERTRIASDLHDGPIQQLTALGIVAQRARRRLARDQRSDADELMEQVHAGVRTEVEALRRLMTELRPPVLDERGLVAALRDHVDAFAHRTGLACQTQLDLPGRLDPEVETVLYRVVQESLTNVAKHACANNVSIHLMEQGDAVALDVRDDGVGFEPARASRLLRAGHFGLASMRERVSLVGGPWEVQAVPGRGHPRYRPASPTGGPGWLTRHSSCSGHRLDHAWSSSTITKPYATPSETHSRTRAPQWSARPTTGQLAWSWPSGSGPTWCSWTCVCLASAAWKQRIRSNNDNLPCRY